MTRAFRILTFQAAIFAACALTLGTLATMTKAAPAQTAAVQIDNFTFKQPVLTVKPGTTVTWTNGDDIAHTVVAKDGTFKSKVLDTGDRMPRLRINLSEAQDADIRRFDDELVAVYRALPQPKSLVIILLTYDRRTRLMVSDGVVAALPRIVDRMRQASGGLTRFEFADLGVRLD